MSERKKPSVPEEIDKVIEQHGGWPGAFLMAESVAEPTSMVTEESVEYGK